MNTKNQTQEQPDWVRRVQAEVGLADAPDPRDEMVRRMKAYPKLVEALRAWNRATTNARKLAAFQNGQRLLRSLGEVT